jgi:hypothetical protein
MVEEIVWPNYYNTKRRKLQGAKPVNQRLDSPATAIWFT